MATSYCFMAVHIVFSTKERYRFLEGELGRLMHEYIGGIIGSLKGEPIIINGMADHVHILCMLPKELSIAEFMRLVKTNSSKWYREKHNPKFNWQVGYGAFTVSKSSLDSVYQYIAAQKEHHAKMPFEDELKALLSKHGMEYLGD